ncbi:hypothetical protein GCM10023188_40540 [Pontibacter saemangeumensis]|uniref:Uncharacterized protein n=1 Tax=Pontibacter saemangeumensis TaxID=1084525 RepID=A0ABP8M284_9BACT
MRVATQGLDNTWRLRSDYQPPCYIAHISEQQTVYVVLVLFQKQKACKLIVCRLLPRFGIATGRE